MKYFYILLGLTSFLQSCDLQKNDSDFTPLVPENTPFIVGVLEATEDTVHHYPEVYVGTVSNPEGFEAELVWTTEGIWWPVTNTLVTRPVTRNDFKGTADTNAKVEISGPLGEGNETTVQFRHEGNGIFGDVEYKLPLQGGKKYKLSVTMGDGRKYIAFTDIPELFNWEVPDSVSVDLELGQFYTGVHKEDSKETVELPFSVGPEVGYIVRKANSEYDYYNFDVPEGGFLFDDRGNFLREGATYGLFDANSFLDKRSLPLVWGGSANNPLRDSEYWWLSISQLNISLSKFYYSLFQFIGTNPDGRWDRQDQARLKALVERDDKFFFGISNILKVGENGEVMPKDQTDAIGVFGGYSAAYRALTVIPQRSWDPDTLNWGNQGN